jgi:hypothetical protein
MKLRHLSILLLLLLFLDVAAAATSSSRRRRRRGQEEVVKPPTGYIWVDPTIMEPIGPWSDKTGRGLGIVARSDVPVGVVLGGRIWATLRTGYIFHLKEGLSQVHSVPMLVGARYGREFGVIEVSVGLEFGGLHRIERREVLDRVDTYSYLTFATGSYVGFRSIGFDIRAGVLFPDVIGSQENLGLLFTLGYMPAF